MDPWTLAAPRVAGHGGDALTLREDLHPADRAREPAAEAPAGADAAVEPSQPTRRGHRALERLAGVSFSFLLFVVCLFLYTRHNDFPYHYHADERSKVLQVVSWNEHRNFNHPQLLLEASGWAMRWFGAPEQTQATAQVGRWCSAVFTAAGVVAVAWIGFAAGGLPGMVIVGAMVGLSPQLLTYAHYMKEDAALVFGLMVMLAGTRATWETHRWWSKILALTLLGAGVALAASGKYVGLIAFALAVPVSLLAPRIRWYARPAALIWMLIIAVALLLTINHRALNSWNAFRADLNAYLELDASESRTLADYGEAVWLSLFNDQFRAGFGRETDHALTAHTGLTMDQPNTYFLSLFGVEVMGHAVVLGAAYVLIVLGTLIVRWRGWWGFWFILFAAGYLAALSMSVIPFNRYFLPVSMMTYLAAGLALVWLVNHGARRFSSPRREPIVRLGLTAVVVLAIVAFQGARCANYLDQFANDSRAEVRRWIAANVPANAVIVAETYAGLTYPSDPRPGQVSPEITHRIISNFFAPELGSIERLRRAHRAEYVVICDLAYRRFLHPQVRPTPAHPKRLEVYREWYERLQREHELIWQSTPKYNMHAFTNPEIRVYRLSQ